MKTNKTYTCPEIEAYEVRVESGFIQSDYSDPGTTGIIDYDSNNDHHNF
ncbi:hypothetical protein [uncultured Alistipes sp.]|jgi:hypothetical protein|nr:hypothetical protein [uncultured Alistipes sp.]